MARRLVLDTGVLIAAECQREAASHVIDAVDDIVIAAVTVAELLAGAELADDRHCGPRSAFVQRVLATIPVEAYDVGVAEVHARLLAAVRRSGTTRAAHDLIVAATAVATGRTIVTSDTGARFADLSDVHGVIVVW